MALLILYNNNVLFVNVLQTRRSVRKRIVLVDVFGFHKLTQTHLDYLDDVKL